MAHQKPTLVVLAAGMGSRYGSLKQIDAFGPNGETIMEYSVYDAWQAGFGKVVFIIRRTMEQEFTEAVVKDVSRILPIELVFQELENIPAGVSVNPNRQKPWGTGHAILSAAGVVKEPFAVINADDFYGASAYKQVANFFQGNPVALGKPAWCLVGYPLSNTLSPHGAVSRALCEVDQNNHLKEIRELKEITAKGETAIAHLPNNQQLALNGQEMVSMNFWGFTPAVFPLLEKYFLAFLKEQGHQEKSEFYLSEAVNLILQDDLATVKVLLSEDQWLGVTYPEDKATVIQQFARLKDQNVYPLPLW